MRRCRLESGEGKQSAMGARFGLEHCPCFGLALPSRPLRSVVKCRGVQKSARALWVIEDNGGRALASLPAFWALQAWRSGPARGGCRRHDNGQTRALPTMRAAASCVGRPCLYDAARAANSWASVTRPLRATCEPKLASLVCKPSGGGEVFASS